MRPENIEKLGENDIVLAGYPGSGAAWIGCLLVKLGFYYLDGYHEILQNRTSQISTVLPIERRDRLQTYRDRDKLHSGFKEPLRIIKTHLTAEAIGANPHIKVIVLVRDGRDAILSYYHWLKSFSGLTISLDEFITHGIPKSPIQPARAWAEFNEGWLDGTPVPRVHLLRFEDMRSAPETELSELLDFMGASRPLAELQDSIHDCSFTSMQKKESEAIEKSPAQLGAGMIMRRGEIGEWRNALTAQQLALVDSECHGVLARLGYPRSY